MSYLKIYLSIPEKKKCIDIMDMEITTGTAGNGPRADMAAVVLVSAGAASGISAGGILKIGCARGACWRKGICGSWRWR